MSKNKHQNVAKIGRFWPVFQKWPFWGVKIGVIFGVFLGYTGRAIFGLCAKMGYRMGYIKYTCTHKSTIITPNEPNRHPIWDIGSTWMAIIGHGLE